MNRWPEGQIVLGSSDTNTTGGFGGAQRQWALGRVLGADCTQQREGKKKSPAGAWGEVALGPAPYENAEMATQGGSTPPLAAG